MRLARRLRSSTSASAVLPSAGGRALRQAEEPTGGGIVELDSRQRGPSRRWRHGREFVG